MNVRDEDAIEDLEATGEYDDAKPNSDLAAALIRLRPHPSPDLREAIEIAAVGESAVTLH